MAIKTLKLRELLAIVYTPEDQAREKRSMLIRRYEIDLERYPPVNFQVKICALCSFAWSDVHHRDHEHRNDDEDNLVNLCPNHHRMVHANLICLLSTDWPPLD